MDARRTVPATALERREALILAAFDSIFESGFEGLRLRDVAERVGIDHSTLHHYFPTKADLIIAVVAHATRMFWPTMPTGDDPAPRLRGHLLSLSQMMHEQPELFVVLGELDLRSRRDVAIRSILDDQEAGWRSALTDLFERGTADRVWPSNLDAAAAVELIIATVKGIALVPDRAPAALGQLADLFTGQERDV